MVGVAQPASLSVYRGQSRTGKGEGPGKTILHGEQYLWVDPELYDVDLLDIIRPWMTLDSDPADHQRLNEQLEAWSLFPYGPYLFVVRLVPAGIYDRRAAYFAHGRAWKREARPTAFDPGLNLGRSDAFDQPWRDETPVNHAAEVPPSLVRREQVSAEAETAALFLGHLFQAVTAGYPLVIAVPLGDFASDGALHALISLSRGGLPADRGHQCRIRVYSRSPDLFLRHLGADLVVIPEDVAGSALTARPNATLLDRQGKKVVGKELDQRALDYAKAVVERAIAVPDGLPYFSRRFHDRVGQDLPSAEDARGVQITYNLAFALAGPAERRGELLRRYLPRAAEKLGPRLNWPRLISQEEWREFPREALLDQLLNDSGDLGEGGREFLREIEKAASGLELRVDERLADWWNPEDPRKVRRLLELLAHDPSLVSSDAAATRTAEIPLERFPQGATLSGVLSAEARSGALVRRAHESAALAVRARNSEVFEVLSRAVSGDRIDPGWARIYAEKSPAVELVDRASAWLRDPHFWRKWSEVPERLLDRLRRVQTLPAGLGPLLMDAGSKLNPVDNIGLHLRLAEVLTRIDETKADAVTGRLWHRLPDLTDPQRQILEDVAFDPEWRCLDIARLDLQALLHFAAGFQKDESDVRFYAELDTRMRRDAEATTAALVREGWWYFWRCRSRLESENAGDEEILRRSAFAWLGTEVWTGEAAKEATLEAWEKAVADLPKVLSGSDVAALRDHATGRRRWPWIPPFEDEQLDTLIHRAGDLGTLAELAEAASDWSPPEKIPIYEYILKKSPLKGVLPASSLGWLMNRYGGSQPDILNEEQSAYLYRRAGHRAEQALVARIKFVADVFERDPRYALMVAADNPDLWGDQQFLFVVAEWMNNKGSLREIDTRNAKCIDEHATVEPARGPESPSQDLIRELVDHGFNKAARLLNPKFQREVAMERLTSTVITALIDDRVSDSCWRSYAQVIQSFESQPLEKRRGGRHPLTELAERIRAREDLSHDQRNRLARNAWQTFASAAAETPGLITPLAIPPLADARMRPLLDLAASLLGPGALGLAAVQLAFAITNPSWREDVRLWQSLLRAVRDFKRYGDTASADDRQNLAVALMFGSLDRAEERRALSRALKYEAGAGWRVPIEFGESTV